MTKWIKIILTFTIIYGIMLISSRMNVVKATNTPKEIIVQYNQEIDAKMLENIKTTKFKALLTSRAKVEALPTQEEINKYYYNQLQNDISRNTYNALANQISNKVIVELNNVEYNIDEETESEIIQCFVDNIVQYVLDGYEAFIMDGSKNYWWTPEDLEIGEIKVDVNEGKAKYKTVEIKSKAKEWSEYENFNTKFKEVCNSITGDTPYEIARSVNYYICNNVEYRTLENTTMEQSAYGALILNQAVCEGQIQLFSLICREKGIICLNIYGWASETITATAHAWNYIYEPKNEKWYAVDVTWNNYEDNFLYFMVGNDTEIKGTKFSKNHLAGFKQFINQTYTPSSPTLSSEKYIDSITIDGEYIKNIQPDTSYNEFIKEFSNKTNFTVMEGNDVITGDDLIKTGQTFNIGNLRYIVIVKGDVNGDGKADIKDILRINKHRLNKQLLKNEFLKAGYVDKGERSDIKDLLRINKYRLGKINEL